MKLVVWGDRGSIPVSGPGYVRYGGDTTCAALHTESGALVVLDAGTGLRALGNQVLAEGRTEIHFLLSHAHWDHLLGFPFFKPLYRKGVSLYFHGCTCAQESLHSLLQVAMKPPFFPVDLSQVAATLHFTSLCQNHFDVAGLDCRTLPLSHPDRGAGFRLTENGRSLCFFPDSDPWYPHHLNPGPEAYAGFFRDTDLLIHDSEYRQEEYDRFSRGWGHSVFTRTVDLARESGAGRLLLWHHNQDRLDDALDAMEAEARDLAPMPCDAARVGMELVIR